MSLALVQTLKMKLPQPLEAFATSKLALEVEVSIPIDFVSQLVPYFPEKWQDQLPDLVECLIERTCSDSLYQDEEEPVVQPFEPVHLMFRQVQRLVVFRLTF